MKGSRGNMPLSVRTAARVGAATESMGGIAHVNKRAAMYLRMGRDDLADIANASFIAMVEADKVIETEYATVEEGRTRIPRDVYEAVTVSAWACVLRGGVEEAAMAYQSEGHTDMACRVVHAFEALADALISVADTDIGKTCGWFGRIDDKGEGS